MQHFKVKVDGAVLDERPDLAAERAAATEALQQSVPVLPQAKVQRPRRTRTKVVPPPPVNTDEAPRCCHCGLDPTVPPLDEQIEHLAYVHRVRGEPFDWLNDDTVQQRLREKLIEGDLLAVETGFLVGVDPSYGYVVIKRGGKIIQIPRTELVFADMPKEAFSMPTDREMIDAEAARRIDAINWNDPGRTLEAARALLEVANLFGCGLTESRDGGELQVRPGPDTPAIVSRTCRERSGELLRTLRERF